MLIPSTRNLKQLLQYTPWIFVYAILLTLYTINSKYYETQGIHQRIDMPSKYLNMLDGCYHVYIDVGSNLGVQVRKLMEPSKYPDANNTLRLFNFLFGNETVRTQPMDGGDSYMCVVGFEPNSHLTQYLRKVESSYNKCGWRVKFLTETGVSDHYGTTQFYSDGELNKYEWGGGILPHKIITVAKDNSTKDDGELSWAYQTWLSMPKDHAKVDLIRLSDFLQFVVGSRRIPLTYKKSSHKPPRVAMKIDIEGSEVDVLPDLLFSGGLEFVNVLMIEWHSSLQLQEERKNATILLKSIIGAMSNYSTIMEEELGRKHAFRLVNLDDETYGLTKYELPRC